MGVVAWFGLVWHGSKRLGFSSAHTNHTSLLHDTDHSSFLRLCAFWARGSCKRGTSCAFAHGEAGTNHVDVL